MNEQVPDYPTNGRTATQTPRKNFNIAIFAQNSATEYSGGRYHSWMMAEALAHAGHRVQYVTNNLPVFYGDFHTFPHHRDIEVCLLHDLGGRRTVDALSDHNLLQPVPFAQLLAESSKTIFNDANLGPELLTSASAAGIGEWEQAATGPYQGTYGARLSAVEKAGEPGIDAETESQFCLKIVSRGAERSGINHPTAKVKLLGGRRYLITCRLFCAKASSSFRLGVKSETSGNLWAVNISNISISYASKAGQWVHLMGTLSLPADGDHLAQAWIMQWEKGELAWYLDDISIREITNANLTSQLDDAATGGAPHESKLPNHDLSLRRSLQEHSLVICRPFMPDKVSDASFVSYLFVDPERLDTVSILAVAANYGHVFIENEIARRLEGMGQGLSERFKRLESFVGHGENEGRAPRVLFLASNDTHVHTMLHVAGHFENSLFVIPSPACKSEGAGERLRERGIQYIEVDYKDRESQAIEAFAPDVVLCGNDWTSEFIAVHAIVRKRSIPCIALQEGPQDWDQKIKGVDPRKFRNAEILFSQGSVTLKYIRPKYFAITGNPKTDHIEPQPLPERPKIFINLNFTYGQYEECRQQWMEDVLAVCRELELDYIISQHPRDLSQWDDPNLIKSSAFQVREQMLSCSLVISRFSNISYEALTFGRSSVYYNPHGEPMKSFSEDSSGGVMNAFSREELHKVLARHKADPAFDQALAEDYMARHCGPMDRGSIGRVVRTIKQIVAQRVNDNHRLAVLARSLSGQEGEVIFSVLICTHNRAAYLDQCIRSVLLTSPGEINYEIIIVDNASTDTTAEVAQRYAEGHNVRYFHEPRLGLSIARNVGWQNARGKYIVFLDDDGEASPGWLRAFLDVFEAYPEAVACGGRIIARYEGGKPSWVQGVSERFYGEYELTDDVAPCEWVPGGNAAWRREVLVSLGGFDERFGRVGSSPVLGSEESVLIKQALAQGGKLYYSPDALMYHHASRSKLKLSWLLRRYYGQGVTAMRWGLVFGNGWTREKAKRQCLRSLYQAGRMALRIGKWSALLQKDRVISLFFEFAQELGQAIEAGRYAVGRMMLRPPEMTPEHTDMVVLVPNNERKSEFYEDVRQFAQMRRARMILLNFETPNWFNSLSPVKRDESLWANWKKALRAGDLVLSSAGESDRYARLFFEDCLGLIFDYCYPSVNTVVARSLPDSPQEKRIILLTRFIRAEHKGASDAADLICEAMRGYTLVIIVGTGQVPAPMMQKLQERAATHGVGLEFRYKLSDREKFREMKRACLLLFPSMFEGFGLPPVEALYCNVPCIAFDLPVLREICGEMHYVELGDFARFREKIGEFLACERDSSHLRRQIQKVARFEQYVQRADKIVQNLMRHQA